MFYCFASLILLIILHIILDLQLLGNCSTNQEQTAPDFAQQQMDDVNITVQFSADVYNHYDMKQRSLFIAPLVVIYCRELALHHRPQGAT